MTDETLREAVEALAAEWAEEGPSLVSHAYNGGDVHEGQTLERCADDLRALLAEHPATPAERPDFEQVFNSHRTLANSPGDCVCACDRTWRKVADYRAHLAAVLNAEVDRWIGAES